LKIPICYRSFILEAGIAGINDFGNRTGMLFKISSMFQKTEWQGMFCYEEAFLAKIQRYIV